MENITENAVQNNEVTTEMSENTSFGNIEPSNELPLPQLPSDALSLTDNGEPQFGQLFGQGLDSDLGEFGAELVVPPVDLASNGSNLVPVSDDLGVLPLHLEADNGELVVKTDNLGLVADNLEAIDSDLVHPTQSLEADSKIAKIVKYIKSQPPRQKKGSPPIGVYQDVYDDIALVTEKNSPTPLVSMTDYVSEILKYHREFFDIPFLKIELAETKEKLNQAINENLRLKMDKKQVEESAQILESVSQSHLNAKQDTLGELQQKQFELDHANQTIATLRLGIDNVSDEVQKAYEDYLSNILPETLKASLKDTYDEIMNIVKSNRLPKDFETFENFFYDSYQHHMESIKKQQEIKKLAKSKNNE